MAHAENELLRLAHLNHAEFCREMGRWSGHDGVVEERYGMLLWRTATPFPVVLNAGVRLYPGDAGSALDAADDFFADRGGSYSLILSERDGADDDLAEQATARGFMAFDPEPEMVRRTPVDERPAPSGIEVRWVDDVAGVADFVAVSDAAYQSLGLPAGVITATVTAPERLLEPHLHTVVAYDDNRPVAAAQTLLSHGIAGVFFVGVIPDARGRGLADLVTRAATNRGFSAGAEILSLQATAMGEPVYRKMGWESVYDYRGMARFGSLT